MPLPLIIALVFFLLTNWSEVRADTIGMNLVSEHSPNPHRQFQDVNPGLYYKHASGFGFGVYWNSYDKLAGHVDYTTPEWHYLSITGTLASGYPQLPILPIIMPSVRIPIYREYSLRLGYIPASLVNKDFSDVKTAMFEKEF